MKDKLIKEIDTNISDLVIKILLPLRIDKVVNEEAVENLYIELDKLVELIKGEKNIPRYTASLLFYLYSAVESELFHAGYTNLKNPLFLFVATFHDYLYNIFGYYELYNDKK